MPQVNLKPLYVQDDRFYRIQVLGMKDEFKEKELKGSVQRPDNSIFWNCLREQFKLVEK